MTDAARPDAATALASFCAAARHCAATMHESARYIARELPAVKAAEPHRQAVAGVCEQLMANWFDIRTELDELAALGLAPNADTVQLRVERIHRWLGEHLPAIDRVVTALSSAARDDRDCGGAFVLVAESVANVLVSFGAVTKARERYAQACAE